MSFHRATIRENSFATTLSTSINPKFEYSYGKTELILSASGNTLEFSFLGKIGKVEQYFTIVYDLTINDYTTTSIDAIAPNTPAVVHESETLTRLVFNIVQKTQFTISDLGDFTWHIPMDRVVNTDSGETYVTYTINEAFVEIHPLRVINAVLPPVGNEVHITISGLPMTDFQEVASVEFLVTNDTSRGCASGNFKQLVGEYDKTTKSQEIHVLNPFLYCYLAGKGEFTVDKLFSINKQNVVVWPQVFLYAMTKFILHRLMTSCFDMDIVYRKNTKRFLEDLKHSKYSNFLVYFEQNFDNEKYFI